MDEEKYLKGFNAGYLMQEKSPELYKNLSENLSLNNEFVSGLKDGGEQYIKEARSSLMKDSMDDLDPDKITPDKSPNITKDRDKHLDK